MLRHVGMTSLKEWTRIHCMDTIEVTNKIPGQHSSDQESDAE